MFKICIGPKAVLYIKRNVIERVRYKSVLCSLFYTFDDQKLDILNIIGSLWIWIILCALCTVL
jgi:hypothetical protein